ncbi:hypothetical protein [Methylobacterium sp. ID0610]|uniref:hypothetical protein n=1 Tax=Methylobacterium carpenticola TaxID=3344827 RepID=UPI0036A09A3C
MVSQAQSSGAAETRPTSRPSGAGVAAGFRPLALPALAAATRIVGKSARTAPKAPPARFHEHDIVD